MQSDSSELSSSVVVDGDDEISYLHNKNKIRTGKENNTSDQFKEILHFVSNETAEN